MTNEEFDHIIKRNLGQFEPPYDADSWDKLNERIESNNELFDDAVRDAVAGLGATEVGDWGRMEQMIMADEDTAFDQDVREEVHNYDAPYDPATWPAMHARIKEDERRRRDLIISKIMEAAAVMLALLTFINIWPDLRPDHQQAATTQSVPSIESRAADSNPEDVASGAIMGSSQSSVSNSATGAVETSDADQLVVNSAANQSASSNSNQGANNSVTPNSQGRENGELAALPVREPGGVKVLDNGGEMNHLSQATLVEERADYGSPEPVPSLAINVSGSETPMGVAAVTPVLPGKGIRFGFVGAFDINSLFIPDNRFYADGAPIYFEEKNMLATGYSAGANVLFDRSWWSLETGLIYSKKSYEPNRILKFGQTFDIKTVDFQKITIQSVQIPVNFHWNFDRKGKTRFYAVAGTGLNLITSTHYDLLVESDLRSAPAGSRPSPQQVKEVQEIREDILAGSKFSNMSYMTLQAGMGVERIFNEKFSAYFQPMYMHQVPFFQISYLEGKKLRSASFQAGVRIRVK